MSHFSVLVVGDDVETALAPFDEELQGDPRREYPDAGDIERMATHYGIPSADLDALAGKMEDWYGRSGGIDEDGRLYYVTTYNEDSKWDWYVIGGRWRGFLKAKPGREGEQGELDTFDRIAAQKGEPIRQADGYDVIRKGDVDTDAMEAEAVRNAKERWALYTAATQGTEPNETWKAVRERFSGDVDAAREAYQTQPRIAALHTGPEAEALRERVGFLADWDKFLVGEERYVEEARLGAFSTFAVVMPDGEWYEHGTMGWFGQSYNDKDDWPLQFRKLWDSIPDDYTVSVVDCHI